MKTLKRVARYILYIGILLFLIGAIISWNSGGGCSFGVGIEGFITEPNKTENFEVVDRLHINAEGAKIDFTTDETATQITVNYYADDDEVFVEFDTAEENKLSITQKFGNHISVKKGGVFKITLPENHKFTSVELHINAAELTIDHLQTEYLKLNVNAGDIKLFAVQTKAFDATLNAGNLECDRLDVDYADAAVNAGNIDLEIAGDSTEYTVKTSVMVGGDSPNKTGSTDKYIHANVDVGKISISFIE